MLKHSVNEDFLNKLFWFYFPVKRTHCDTPQEIPNGNYVINLYLGTTSYGIGTSIMYECDEGFLPYGNVVMECSPSGYWSDYPPKCIEKG